MCVVFLSGLEKIGMEISLHFFKAHPAIVCQSVRQLQLEARNYKIGLAYFEFSMVEVSASCFLSSTLRG